MVLSIESGKGGEKRQLTEKDSENKAINASSVTKQCSLPTEAV